MPHLNFLVSQSIAMEFFLFNSFTDEVLLHLVLILAVSKRIAVETFYLSYNPMKFIHTWF